MLKVIVKGKSMLSYLPVLLLNKIPLEKYRLGFLEGGGDISCRIDEIYKCAIEDESTG